MDEIKGFQTLKLDVAASLSNLMPSMCVAGKTSWKQCRMRGIQRGSQSCAAAEFYESYTHPL